MENKKEYLWAMFGRFVPQILYLITTIILARLLSASDFGILGVLSIFFLVAGILMDSGLGGSLVKEVKLSSDDISTIFTFNIVVSIVSFIVMFFVAPIIESYYNISGLKNITRILSFVFVINAFGLVPNAILTKKTQFKEISKSQIIGSFVACIASIIVGVITHNVYALVTYQIIQSLIIAMLYNHYCKYSIRLGFKFSSFKRLVPFGVYTTISSIVDTLYENIIVVIFGKYSSIETAGYFSQAKRIEEVPSKSIVITFSNVSFPILTKYRDNKAKFSKEAYSIYKYFAFLIIPIFFIITIFAKECVLLLFGKDWLMSVSYLKILMISGIFISIDLLFRGYIKSLNKPKIVLKTSLEKRILGIGIIMIAALLSIDYVVYAYLLSSVLGVVISVKAYCKILKISFCETIGRTFRLLIPNIIMFVVVYALSHFNISDVCVYSISIIMYMTYYLSVFKTLNINLRNLFKWWL